MSDEQSVLRTEIARQRKELQEKEDALGRLYKQLNDKDRQYDNLLKQSRQQVGKQQSIQKQQGEPQSKTAQGLNQKEDKRNQFKQLLLANPKEMEKISTNIQDTFVSKSAWEYVIVLQNPDAVGKGDEQFISKERALELFEICFKGTDAQTQLLQDANKKLEKQAFGEAFDDLADKKEMQSPKASVSEQAEYKQFQDDKRRFNLGGQYKKIQVQEKMEKWIDSGTKPLDFLTLIRNWILIKLAHNLSLETKMILSSNGQYIYVLIKADEEDILNEAERSEYNAQFEIGATDVTSLLPCDKNLRTYKTLIKRDAEIQMLCDQVEQIYREIYWEDQEEDEKPTLFQPFEVNDGQWNNYKKYLKEVIRRLEKIRQIQGDRNVKYLYYKKVLLGVLNMINEQEKNKDFKLYNLWDRLQIEKPIGAYVDFRRDQDLNKGIDNFAHESGTRSFFKNTDRLKLIYQRISRQMFLDRLVKEKLIVDHFCLQNEQELVGDKKKSIAQNENDQNSVATSNQKIIQSLYEDDDPSDSLIEVWRKQGCFSFNQPLGRIRNYFGEKVGLYFAFISSYTKALFVLVPFGLICAFFQYQNIFGDDDKLYVDSLYCFVIAIWVAVFIEGWKRTQAKLAVKWGQLDFEEDEVVKPEFHGEERRSPVNDDPCETYFNPNKRVKIQIFGYLISCFILCIVLSLVATIIIMKQQLKNILVIGGRDFTTDLCSTLNAIQILIFNEIYQWVSQKLNSWENHKTQTDYEDSLISKVYMFQFVNSFNSMFYIAFIKTYFQGCLDHDEKGQKIFVVGGSCMYELGKQLTTIYLIAFAKNLVELGVPLLKEKLKSRKIEAKRGLQGKEMQDTSGLEEIRQQIEKQHGKAPYVSRGVDGTFQDYLEMMVQFGYVTLFAVSFPIAPLIAFISNLVEIQVDKIKIIKLVRRPLPAGAEDMGTWQSVIEITANIALISNAGIICFTSEILKDHDNWKFPIFLTLLVILYCIKGALSMFIPDIPESYQEIIKRHKYIIEKQLKGYEPPKKELSDQAERIDLKVHFMG